MADIRDGVNIEISVEDNASEKLGEIEANAKNTGAAAINGFSPLRALTSALMGNFAAMGAELAKLIPSFKGLGAAGRASFGAVGAAVLGVTKLLVALKDLVKTAFNFGTADKDIASIGNSLAKMVESSQQFYDKMDEAREQSETLVKRYEEMAKATAELTKAQNEFNRAQELALANTDEQRTTINARYDAENARIDEDSSADVNANRRKALEEERMRLDAELKRSQDDQAKALADAKRFGKIANESKRGIWNSYFLDEPRAVMSWFTGKKYGNEKALEYSNLQSQSADIALEAAAKEEEIRKKIEENVHQLKLLDLKTETETEKSYARQQTEYTEELRREEAAEDQLIADEVASTEEDAEKDRHDERMADIAAERDAALAAAQRVASAEERLAAAKDAVARAWDMYRNPDKLREYDAEADADSAAREKYRKDLHSVTHGRRAGDLSYMMEQQRLGNTDRIEERFAQLRKSVFFDPNQEATMRVALAERRETDANSDLMRAADAATRAADSLANIESAFNGGDD